MKYKLKYKILFLYAAVSLCVLIFVGALLSTSLKTEKLNSIQASLHNQLAHIDFALTQFFSGIEQDLRTLQSNPDVRTEDDADFTNFTQANEKTFQYRYGEAENRIIAIFARYRHNHDFANSVYMGRENGSFVRSHKRNRPTRYDPRQRPWYQLALQNPGKVMRTAPYTSVTTVDTNIGVVTTLMDPHLKTNGVVGIDVTLAGLTEYLEKISVGRKGYLLLMDGGGTILSAPHKALVSQHIEAICKDDLSLLFSREKGTLTFTRDNQKNYLVFRKSPALGWITAFVIPTGEINQEIRSVVFETLLMLALALVILSALTIVGLETFVIKPLSKLNEGTKTIARTGDLNHTIEIESHDEIRDLADSFNQMTIDLQKHVKKLTETTAARERMESELKIAHDIQMGILPRDFKQIARQAPVDLYAVLEPAKEVGGDLYDFFFIDSHHLCFSVGDVAGKGVPAAVFMSAAKTLIKAVAGSTPQPDKILELANQELAAGNDYCTFVTVFLGILDIRSGEVVYANAGHNPPFVLPAGGGHAYIDGGKGTALGIDDEAIFVSERFVLAPGDGLFLYTDGVTEAFNSNEELFDEQRLERELSIHAKAPVKNMVLNILKAVNDFSGNQPQSDDITIMALRFKP